ncbi:hypothetical protein FGO68_gene17502 [Halteria grandinella]|uniref:Uncharacterized protein n=1 Tax=Halteria grandinella TaxID=5974 RepID=A0A8J8SVX4_HALGN|nr:hypothetical protein FGO68_gene17502 [Halteria grandinella]
MKLKQISVSCQAIDLKDLQKQEALQLKDSCKVQGLIKILRIKDFKCKLYYDPHQTTIEFRKFTAKMWTQGP